LKKVTNEIAHLNKIKRKGIKSILVEDIHKAIDAKRCLIQAFTCQRLFKVYFPLFLLSIPLVLIPVSLIYYLEVIPAEMINRFWSFLLLLGIVIPFIAAVMPMIRNRPYTKYENIHRKILLEKDYENLIFN